MAVIDTHELHGPDVSGGVKPVESSSDESSTGRSPRNNRHRTRRRNRVRPSRHQNKQRSESSSCLGDDSLTDEEQAQYLALDCEMVGVGTSGHQSALARVTIVDYHGHVVYDAFVHPDCQVTDYRTYVSGITPADLEQAHSIDLTTCRAHVQELLRDKILIGHALKNDLNALGIRHPWHMTRDTAKYEPFMKVRFEDGILWPRKLKELCQEYLVRDIQQPGQPHSAYQDAVAALDLYKCVRAKWEKVMEYKIHKTNQIMAMQQQQAAQ